MADEATNPFAFIARLPDATITEEFEKHPGIFIRAALCEGKDRNVFIECVYGPQVPVPVYTLNVGGRGSLVLGEQEFRDIVSASLALFEGRQTEFGRAPTDRAKADTSLPVISTALTNGGEG